MIEVELIQRLKETPDDKLREFAEKLVFAAQKMYSALKLVDYSVESKLAAEKAFEVLKEAKS